MVGSGRTVHALVRGGAVAARGHTVRLVTLGQVLPSSGIEIKTRPVPRNLLQAVRAARSFWRDIRSFEPDLLHVHYAGGKLGTLASLSGVRPLVVTVMGGDVQPEQLLDGSHLFEKGATRRLLREADLILSKSDGLRKDIARYGDFEHKTHTVRWGVDPDRIRPQPEAARALRKRLGIPPGARVMLSPRILRPLYNIHLMLEALPAVLAQVPDAMLVITEHRPDESYRQRLLNRVDELGLERSVRFVGAVDYEDMPALFTLADVAVGVPFSDGLPQSLFEAMACGTPAVVGRLGSYEEMVRDGEHVLCTDLAADAIARTVLRVLTDADLSRRLSAASSQRVLEMACLPREAARVEALYAEVLRKPRRGTSLGVRVLDGLSLLVR